MSDQQPEFRWTRISFNMWRDVFSAARCCPANNVFRYPENANLLSWYRSSTGRSLSTLTRMKSVWYVDSMKTEMLWSASGAMTDLAILVTPIGCELEALPPPDTTLRASHVASATLMCSDWGSSGKGQRVMSERAFCRKMNQQRWEEATYTDLFCFTPQIHLFHKHWSQHCCVCNIQLWFKLHTRRLPARQWEKCTSNDTFLDTSLE